MLKVDELEWAEQTLRMFGFKTFLVALPLTLLICGWLWIKEHR